MGCDQTRVLLYGYLDGELDAVRSAEFEKHLESCSQCASQLEAQENLRASLRAGQLYEKAPAGLTDRVARQLDAVERSRPREASSFWKGLFGSQRWRFATLATVAVVLAAVSPFLAFKIVRQGSAAQNTVVAEAIDAHIRALQPGHLTDVLSTDQHTVKPWFDGKLDYIPPVKDEAENGFPLLGGRLDALGGRTVAALVYGRRKHTINVFVWPASDGEPQARISGTHNGYQWIYWQKGGMEFCAVSDVSEGDLRELAELLQ